MACNIHFYVERFINNQWKIQYLKDNLSIKNYEKSFYYDRNYKLFGYLAGIKYPNISKINATKGYPRDNMSLELQAEVEYFRGHSAHHCSLATFLEDKKHKPYFYYLVSIKEYKHYLKTQSIQNEYNSIQDNILVSNQEMERIINLTPFLDEDKYITEVKIYLDHLDISKEFWEETVPSMMKLDDNPENVRCVYWFNG